MMADRPTHQHRGFTLVELMVVVAILAIILLAAIPSFQRWIESRRLIGLADNVLNDLRYAQSEAIKTGTPVVITFHTDGNTWTYRITAANGDTLRTNSSENTRNTALTMAITPPKVTIEPKRGTIVELVDDSRTLILSITTAPSNLTVGLTAESKSKIGLCSPAQLQGLDACPQ